jgi:hypothetical protein
MKYLFWIYQSFGFKALITYCWDAFWLKIRRALKLSPPPVKFEGLSFDDLEAERDALNGTNKHTLH